MSSSEPTSSSTTDTRGRRALAVVSLTVFVDIVGFSIIFPLYPSMLTYYLEREGDSGVLGRIVEALTAFDQMAGGGVVVLFGGVLGSAYALMQFVGAPILGSLSDRFGRKPILLCSLIGLAVSYVLWIFAGQFWVLLLARFVGGAMSSNTSAATAVVADVTAPEKRARGMALIGMALGLGFMGGPAIGGLAAQWDLTAQWPGLAAYGVNPFSFPAAIAALLTIVNVVWIIFALEETRNRNAAPVVERTMNPIALFTTGDYPGVTRTNLAYFFFLSAFSGMEFSLTFVAAERFGYGPLGNAMLLLFAGVVLALTQGAYVRRRSEAVGPQRMAMHGLICTVPGLVIVGAASQAWMAYVGIAFMAVGSAQVIPCMTGLVSMYTPMDDQGRILGVFRSLGSLARAVGPMFACLVYFRLGSAPAYYLVAAIIVGPLLLMRTLPPVRVDAVADRNVAGESSA